MKKLFVLLMLLLSTGSFAGNKNLKPDIYSIEVNIPGKILIYLGDSGVRLGGDSISKKYVTYHIENGVLIIKSVPGMEDYLKNKSVIIYVSTNTNKVDIRSSRNLYLDRKTKSGNHVKK